MADTITPKLVCRFVDYVLCTFERNIKVYKCCMQICRFGLLYDTYHQGSLKLGCRFVDCLFCTLCNDRQIYFLVVYLQMMFFVDLQICRFVDYVLCTFEGNSMVSKFLMQIGILHLFYDREHQGSLKLACRFVDYPFVMYCNNFEFIFADYVFFVDLQICRLCLKCTFESNSMVSKLWMQICR